MGRAFRLSDAAALDPARAGAKAATLAHARSLGLPVLDGVVVPVEEATPVVERAVEALQDGPAVRARLAATRVGPSPALLAEVEQLTADLGEPLIVRSSSPLEGAGVWSGAFSSFHDISRSDIGTAIRGVWGSAFSVDVLERAEQVGTSPQALGLAVLIQPQVIPRWGGSARIEADGSVLVAATSGPLRALMEGWVEGDVDRVRPDGEVGTESRTPPDVLAAVARLAHEVQQRLGHRLVEWAWTDDALLLLQSQSSSDSEGSQTVDVVADAVLSSPTALRIAALTRRFPGALAAELILPWAVAPGVDVKRVPLADSKPADAAAAFADAAALAGELVARAWQGTPRSARDDAERTLRRLRGPEPADALARIEQLAPVDLAAGQRILELLARVEQALLASGRFDDPAWLWHASTDDVRRLLDSDDPAPPRRLGVDRWEPFAHAVVMASGQRYSGNGVVAGAGAGWAYPVTGDADAPPPSGRYVLVAEQLKPRLAPWLWHAAGLVTRVGNPGAHLLEVARSVGVPTVLGCPLDFDPSNPPLLAVDGAAGQVAVIAASELGGTA